jgi:hypothetical protein
MEPDEFNAALETIGWSRPFLAQKLGMSNDRSIRRWANGQNAIPAPIAGWLRLVRDTLQDLPPPAWRE